MGFSYVVPCGCMLRAHLSPPHPAVDDAAINKLVGDEVLHLVLIPYREQAAGSNDYLWPYNGEIFRLAEVWFDAYYRIGELADAIDTDTLDGREAFGR